MRFWCCIVAVCICVNLAACHSVSPESKDSYIILQQTQTTTETADQRATESPNQHSETLPAEFLQAKEGETVTLAFAGLQQVVVTQKRTITAPREGVFLTAYVLGNYLYSDNVLHDSYLVVEWESRFLFCDLETRSLKDMLFLNDIDADGNEEIILHQHLDDSGGTGTYLARIYRVEKDTISEVFNSDTSSPVHQTAGIFDTGYTSEFLENRKLKIMNNTVGYETILDISKRYMDEFFDESGKCKRNIHIWCDSFFKFTPTDVDGDGISEIVCLQYVSLDGHADGVGYARSILKFNADTERFEIIDAEFLTE